MNATLPFSNDSGAADETEMNMAGSPQGGGGGTIGAILATAAVVLAVALMISLGGGLRRPLESANTVVAAGSPPHPQG